LPISQFNKDVLSIAREVKAVLRGKKAERRESERAQSKIESRKQERRNAREALRSKREALRSKKQQLKKMRNAVGIGASKKKKKSLQQEIFELERGLRATKEHRTQHEPETGALPDFVVIGAKKCGTTFFYHLLSQHPLVEPAASKELHFFDVLFEEGTEWYRRCFPKPRWKDGRKTITGEASPGYIWHPLAPERMAGVIPEVRLIALLRNPVDRAYSDYYQRVKNGRAHRTFEEAVQAAFDDPTHGHLSKSIYVDHLRRWSGFFGDEQMLVLKSEDFFGRPVETLKVALNFLDLPEWEPEGSELQKKRNAREYDEMDPATRRRLEEYFEPHNRRLYDFLGLDFSW